MPTYRPTIEPSGFTLIEMLVVLAIIALVAGLAASRMQPGAASTQRRLVALRTTLLDARAAVMVSGHARTIAAKDLGDDVTFDGGSGAGRLTYYPDGSASGSVIALAGKPVYVVDWLSGIPRDAR